jgi:hypothetical protein
VITIYNFIKINSTNTQKINILREIIKEKQDYTLTWEEYQTGKLTIIDYIKKWA